MKTILLLLVLVQASQTPSCYQRMFGSSNTNNSNSNTQTTSNYNAQSNSEKSTAADFSVENARTQAKSCVEAQYQADAAKYIECLHPEIINSEGGREKTLADLNQMFKMTGKIPYTSIEASTPKEVKKTDKAMMTVVPYQVTRKNSGGETETSKDFFIGVSEDGGKTWKFATSAKYSPLEKKFPGVKDLETPDVGMP